jgi:hypothetical protein
MWGRPPSAVQARAKPGATLPNPAFLLFPNPQPLRPISDIRAPAIAIINASGGNSSTGRAPDCGSDGCGFDSRFPPQILHSTARHHGPVAQLDRASVFGTEGWGFEPLRGHHWFSAKLHVGTAALGCPSSEARLGLNAAIHERAWAFRPDGQPAPPVPK